MDQWLDAAGKLREEIIQRFLDPQTRQLVTYSEHFNTDFIPTPDEARSGTPMPTSYSTGIEDGALRGAALLAAMCDEYDLRPTDELQTQANTIFGGLQRAQYGAPSPGFVPRWLLSDGKTCYSNSSGDQHTILIYGLWRYCKSPMATPEHRIAAGSITGSVIGRIRKHGWRITALDGGDAHAGGGIDRVRLLALLAAAYDMTGVRQWRDMVSEHAEADIEQYIKRMLGNGPATPAPWGFYAPEQFTQLLGMLIDCYRGDPAPFQWMRSEIARRFLKSPIPTSAHTPAYSDECLTALGDAAHIDTPFDALGAFKPELLGAEEDRSWRRDHIEWTSERKPADVRSYILWWLGKRPAICHERNCIISPMVAFHICLKSEQEDLIEQVRGPIEQHFENVEFTSANKLGSLSTAYATALAMARFGP